LNLILSLLCIQLTAKHRAMQIDDREKLKKLEDKLGLPRYYEKPEVEQHGYWQRQLRTSSVPLWMIGFGVLAVVALGIFATTLGRALWDFAGLYDSAL
jgi:hypothetical protein